jgi:hypothetical protein
MAISTDPWTEFIRQIQTPRLKQFVVAFGLDVKRSTVDYRWIFEFRLLNEKAYSILVRGDIAEEVARQAYVEFCKQRMKGA